LLYLKDIIDDNENDYERRENARGYLFYLTEYLHKDIDEITEELGKIKKIKIDNIENDIEESIKKIGDNIRKYRYEDSKGESYIKSVIIARIIADYIASMTDRMAEKKHEEIKSTETKLLIC